MLDSELYTIGEVAAILGVSAHTIRAWERRHGMVHPQRTRARHRRYRGEDVELLRDVKRAIDLNGLSLRLAFQAVSGGQQPLAIPTPSTNTRQSERWPLSGEAGVWRAVADVLPQLIMVIDPEGKIAEANVATAKAFGTTRQKLTGRSFADLVDPFDRSKAVLLYRPQLKIVKDWELNLTTQNGPQLYSFQSWHVRLDGGQSLAVVGSEMYVAARQQSTGAAPDAAAESSAVLEIEKASIMSNSDAFQTLVDQLPFGVAVTTVGSQPRVVFANGRLTETLGTGSEILTGRPLSEVVPGDAPNQALRDTVATSTGRTLKALPRAARHGEPETSPTYLNVGFQPLVSSTGKVTSVLVVVEDATVDVALRDELERLVADQRFERAKTEQQLARVGLEHVTTLVPDAEFAIALIESTNPGDPPSIRASTPSWRAIATQEARSHVEDAIARAVARGTTVEVKIIDGRVPLDLTVVPLLTRSRSAAKRKLGAVALRRSPDKPLPPEHVRALYAFVARLALAAELLNVRTEAARKASRLESVITAASVVSSAGGHIGLGTRFLGAVSKALGADGVSIGRIVGAEFVVDAAYAPGGAHARPGDRFPVAGRFVSESVRTGRPTSTSQLVSPVLPTRIKKALAPMKHGLAVPLKLDGQVVGVLTLSRTRDVPFNQEDVLFVQTLSSVALLAVTLGQRDRSPSRHDSADSRAHPSRTARHINKPHK